MNTANPIQLLFTLAFLVLVAALVYNYYKKRITSQSERYSTFGPRFWAPSIDAVVLWPFTTLLPFIILYFVPSAYVALSVLTTLAFYAYTIYFNANFGGTVGKSKCHIRVVDAKTEEEIGYKQALLRDSIPLVLSIILYSNALSQEGERIANSEAFLIVPAIMGIWFIAEILTMLTNEKRRALHDLIAGTVVIRVENSNNKNDTTPIQDELPKQN